MMELNGKSMDIKADNIEKMKQLFPEAFEEGKIDFDKLRQLLGDYVDDNTERYNFTWNGKGQALRLSQTPSMGTLRPCKEESKDWDTTQNLYIEGDNLEVLKLLQKSYHNKIKMIYIDPPYNTGHDFVYKDNYINSIENYRRFTGQEDDAGNSICTSTESNGRYHTDWLNMIYPRLRLARNLLKYNGIIFISIDYHELAHLKDLCESVFGLSNYIGTLVLQTATDNNPGQIKIEHEYMLCYAKDKKSLDIWQAPSKKANEINVKYLELRKIYGEDIDSIQVQLRKWIKQHKEELKGVTHYDNVDEKGVFHDGDIANTVFGGYRYNVVHPVTGKVCKIPDKGFRFPETTMEQMIKNGNIMFGLDETTLIKPKIRIEDCKDVLRSIIYEDGRTSTKKFEQLMARDIFQNPKSDTVLTRIINFIVADNDIVLDFFSGSGTTAESVINSSMQMEKNIQFLLVQLPENLDKNLLQSTLKVKKTLQKGSAT